MGKLENIDASENGFFSFNPVNTSFATDANNNNNNKLKSISGSNTIKDMRPSSVYIALRENERRTGNLTSISTSEECIDMPDSPFCRVNSHVDSVRNEEASVESQMTTLEGVKELLAYKRQRFQSMDSFESIASSRSKSKRLVTKDGFVDIKYANIPGLNSRYLKDIFHTLMDMKWRYITGLFTISFLLTWIFFGTIWFFIILHRPERNCLDNVDSWVSAFLFSIETQTTIGYGGRAVTPNCVEGVLLLVVQTIVGMFVNCAMLGLLFAKLARPKNRGKTTMFSKRAVITVRDGQFCLMFRYVDLRHRRLLDTNMRAVIIRPKLTEEGEFIPIDMADLKLSIDFKQEEYNLRLFPLFPLTIIHVIDEKSPIYTMSKAQLDQSEFEIIPILEGTVPTTGNSTQALTSYRPGEIQWGQRFKPVFTGMHIGQNINRIDLSTLHDTYKESHTPHCSAEMYHKTKCTPEDCTSLESESHGYESGPASTYSMSYQYNKRYLDLGENDLEIDISEDFMQQIPLMTETEA